GPITGWCGRDRVPKSTYPRSPCPGDRVDLSGSAGLRDGFVRPFIESSPSKARDADPGRAVELRWHRRVGARCSIPHETRARSGSPCSSGLHSNGNRGPASHCGSDRGKSSGKHLYEAPNWVSARVDSNGFPIERTVGQAPGFRAYLSTPSRGGDFSYRLPWISMDSFAPGFSDSSCLSGTSVSVREAVFELA